MCKKKWVKVEVRKGNDGNGIEKKRQKWKEK